MRVPGSFPPPLPLLLSLLALASCAVDFPGAARGEPVSLGICGPVDPRAGFAARDSAGIRIVENLRAARGDGDGRRLAPEPLTVIGARESDPDDPIGRLASALLLEDGRVVVGDALTHVIRVHAPDGALLHRFGGDGTGPGEFSRSLAIHRGAGDTLVVAHEFGVRYARMLPDGTYLDGGWVTAAPGETPVYHSLLGVFGDGRFLVLDRELLAPRSADRPRVEVVRLEHAAVRMLEPGMRTDSMASLGSIPRQDYFTVVQSGEFEGFTTFGDVPFGRVESWAVGHSELFVGEGSHFEVERRSWAGELQALVRVCEEPRRTTPEELRRAVEEHVARSADPRSQRLELAALEAIALPEVAPAHLEMRAERGGRLWVRGFAPDWEPQEWRVFDTEGRWVESLALPAGLRLLDIGEDRLLAAVTNELGVETVQVYAIR